MSDMDIVSRDKNFALVRLKSGQSYEDLAFVFHGDPGQRWQISEVNAAPTPRAGQIVAVPLRAMNSSSVYIDGYRTLPVLCYHQFTAQPRTAHQLELSASAFESQIKYLRENNFVILSFADLEAILQNNRPIPEKSVVITIDDGYRSVYDIAWPILEKYRVPATLFIYTDFIGAPAAMSWEQLREMSDSGLIEIESHGKSHASLAMQPDETKSAYTKRLQEEFELSNRVFRKMLGAPPRYLSYPYGDSSEVAARVAREAGIKLAATVTRGDLTVYSDPYLLNRTMIYDSHDMAAFKKLLRVYRKKNLR